MLGPQSSHLIQSTLLTAMRKHTTDVLRDSYHRFHDYLRISLTERCNLRCRYCMPETGVNLTPREELLTLPELQRLVRIFAHAGVRKVRLTGGEPLLRRDIVDVVRFLRQDCGISEVGITTNGLLLSRYLMDMYEAGLTSLNISLDTMDEDKFIFLTRQNGLHKVLDAIALAEHIPNLTVKINCVMLRGVNTDELLAFARLTRDRHVDVRLIEYMPFDANKWENKKMFSFMEAMDAIEQGLSMKMTPARSVSYAGSSANSGVSAPDVAKMFTLPQHIGRIGFITTMSLPFCSTCNRLRLTADGNLKVCLFDERETSLRDPLRAGATDSELLEVIRCAVQSKFSGLGGKESPADLVNGINRPMITIGG